MANKNLSRDQVRAALDAAASAHHDYEQVTLNGEHDKQWPGFYAAYVLGKLNDFMSSSDLARILNTVEAKDSWSEVAANAVVERIHKAD